MPAYLINDISQTAASVKNTAAVVRAALTYAARPESLLRRRITQAHSTAIATATRLETHAVVFIVTFCGTPARHGCVVKIGSHRERAIVVASW